MYPKLKVPTIDKTSPEKINQKNFRVNGHNSRDKIDANSKVHAAVNVAAKHRFHDQTMQNALADDNRIPTNNFDNVNFKYDESALSRCALLFIGSICQQGKIRSTERRKVKLLNKNGEKNNNRKCMRITFYAALLFFLRIS